MVDELAAYLAPTPGVTCQEPEVLELARRIARGSRNDVEAARRLFDHVRDQVVYSPYVPFWEVEHYRATAILGRGFGYCVQKAVLLAALARSLGIPARLGFADIVNHRLSDKLRDMLGTNLMVFHGWTELFLAGRWLKATPAFDQELCRERGWPVVDFNGLEDALMPGRDLEGRPLIEYVRLLFNSAELPLKAILTRWEEVYTAERLAGWRRELIRRQD